MNQALDQLFDKIAEKKSIHNFAVYIEGPGLSYRRSHQREEDEPFVLASVTKLFTSVACLALARGGRLALEDGLGTYFSREEIEGISLYQGQDLSQDIRIKNLLYQNSGLAQTAREVLPMSKRLKARPAGLKGVLDELSYQGGLYPPGQARAHYASANFLLLGDLVSRAYGARLDEALEELVFKPLAMEKTYLAREGGQLPPSYFKDQVLDLGSYLVPTGGAGAGISTAADLMLFLKALVRDDFLGLKGTSLGPYYDLQPSFGPIKYGLGHMRVDLGPAYMLGHNGISGAYAFYMPERDLYLTGTFNQFADQTLSIRLGRDLVSLFEAS